MMGELELRKLLATMRPELHKETFVFCSVSVEQLRHLTILPIGWFREAEGVTLILEKDVADIVGLKYEFVSRMITLTVHSSLEAIGFIAAITNKLASAGISVNPISAYYHDHLFVPFNKAEAAMRLLNELTSSVT